MSPKKKTSNEGSTPALLASTVKEVLMKKPYQFKDFKVFAEYMGKDYLPFVNECKKQVKSAKKRKLAELKREIKKLETELKEPNNENK